MNNHIRCFDRFVVAAESLAQALPTDHCICFANRHGEALYPILCAKPAVDFQDTSTASLWSKGIQIGKCHRYLLVFDYRLNNITAEVSGCSWNQMGCPFKRGDCRAGVMAEISNLTYFTFNRWQ